MSEFKFACPVCGQHMMCDAEHGGSVMECPTCFQKIVAPQAPAPDAKFILTGTKLTEKKITVRGFAAASPASVEDKNFPTALLVSALVVVLAVGAGFFFFGGKFLHPGSAKGWQSRDIGNVRTAGSVGHAKGVFTVSGDGADIWDQADAFRYVFQTLNGDGTLTARVLKIKNTDPWAKAGVMIRESLEANSIYTVAVVTPSSGITFQQRDRTGGPASTVIVVPNLAAPYWVRLVRQANTFTAYSSENGTSWTKLGATTMAMGSQTYAGLAVCSHTDGTLTEAQFDNVALQTNTGAGRAAPPAPKPGAPPANDTNWLLELNTNSIPDAPVAGRIRGQDFLVERATLQNGTLTLRARAKGTLEFGVQINFGGAQAESLSGQTIRVAADTDKAAKISLRWKDDAGEVQKAGFDSGYAMRLEFGALANNRLPGKIWLCTPDAEKSYLLGSFSAIASKPKPKPPQP
jgi:regulation of enolase protein 1 (concanavalin A-like superfamily)